jgi:hypothetical protein
MDEETKQELKSVLWLIIAIPMMIIMEIIIWMGSIVQKYILDKLR